MIKVITIFRPGSANEIKVVKVNVGQVQRYDFLFKCAVQFRNQTVVVFHHGVCAHSLNVANKPHKCGRMPHCIFQVQQMFFTAITFKNQFVIIVLELFGMYSMKYMP